MYTYNLQKVAIPFPQYGFYKQVYKVKKLHFVFWSNRNENVM